MSVTTADYTYAGRIGTTLNHDPELSVLQRLTDSETTRLPRRTRDPEGELLAVFSRGRDGSLQVGISIPGKSLPRIGESRSDGIF